MKCKVCDGSGITKGYDAILGRFFDMKCFACDGSGEVDRYEEEKEEPLTNKEWLKQCNTEQLAEEVYKLVWCSNELFQQMECSGIDTKENDLKIVTEWLKQPHYEQE